MALIEVDAPTVGPCVNWATPEDVSACGCCAKFDELNPDLLALNLTIASQLLFRKSGMQWTGTCSETVRPCCLQECRSLAQGWGYPWWPTIVSGRWYNMGGCVCAPWDCGQNVPTIDLAQYPVTEITRVQIGTDLFTADQIRLDNWRYLIRVDGELWPETNNLLGVTGDDGVFEIEFKFGPPPPTIGMQAAAQLGCELTKHCQGMSCELPLRVTALNRNGVTYSLPDVMDILDRHKTGLYQVDLFLDSVNPNNLDRPPRVLAANRRTPRRTGSGA